MRTVAWVVIAASAMATCLVEGVVAQSPAPAVQANLNQLMRGAFYPASNVVFAAQDQNPADVPRAKDPNMATDLLTSIFGKWEAVENSALSIADMANMLLTPGRKCENGLDAPVTNPDWARFVQELRDAGRTAYNAAKTKDQDKMIDAAGVLSTACNNCHRRYRDNGKSGTRCK